MSKLGIKEKFELPSIVKLFDSGGNGRQDNNGNGIYKISEKKLSDDNGNGQIK